MERIKTNSLFEEILRFRSSLQSWGKTNIQPYPWRYVADPYKVLVSEFMLQRTRTNQVIPIYENFIRLCPTLEAFGKTNRKTLERILRPLGLNWRIRGMLSALKAFWDTYGFVPIDFEELFSTPSIGQYIAGAVVCFTTNLPITFIDSNIVRVVGRVFGIESVGEGRRNKFLIQAVASTVDPKKPRDFYYALIDLAHTICHHSNPSCFDCPLMNVPCRFGNAKIASATK